MDRGILQATIHRVTKNQMLLSTQPPKVNCGSFLLNVASAEC